MAGASLEPDAFVVLIARNERRIRGFLATLVAFDRGAVDDLLQATYLAAWRKLEGFRYEAATPDEEAVRWIMAIARYEAFNYMRSCRKHTPQAFSDSLLDRVASEQSEHTDYYEARRSSLAMCFSKLSEVQQDFIRLRYGVGLSLTEIGARTQRLPNTVAATLSRIRKVLERCVTRALKEDGYC